MASKGKDTIIFKVKIEDLTKEGLDKVAQQAQRAGQKVKQATGGMIGQGTREELAQFNERSEKIRQILNLTGGAASQAAGSIIYYGATVGFLVGKLKAWHWVIAGIGGAIALFGSVIIDAIGPIEDLSEKFDELNTSSKNLLETNEKFIQSQIDAMHGITPFEAKIRTNTEAIDEHKRAIEEMTPEYEKLSQAVLSGNVGATIMKEEYEKLDKSLDEHKHKLWELTEQNKELARTGDRVATAKRTKEIIAEEKRAAKERLARWKKEQEAHKRNQQKKVRQFTKGLQDMLRAEEEAFRARRQLADRQIAFVEEYLAEEEAKRQIAWNRKYENWRSELAIEAQLNEQRFQMSEKQQEEQQELERQAAEFRMQLAQMGADAMVGFAQALASGSASAIRDTLKAMAIEALARAAWHGIMAIASAYFAPWEAAHHATVAAMFAGFAATYGAGAGLASIAASGGGGGRTPASGNRYAGQPAADRQGEGGQEGQSLVINVYGHQFFGQDAGEQVWNWVDAYQRSQNPGRETERF